MRRRRDGDVWGATSGGRVHMYGARVRPVLPPHRAARQERERRARPRRRLRHPPARPADERLADQDPRSLLAVLAGTVQRVEGPDHEPMPAGRDRPAGQARPRRGRRARRTGRRRWRSGSGHRPMHHPTFLPGGEAARPWEAATGARVRRPRRRRCSWPTSPVIHDPDVAWRVNGLAAKDGIEPSDPKSHRRAARAISPPRRARPLALLDSGNQGAHTRDDRSHLPRHRIDARHRARHGHGAGACRSHGGSTRP